ncbi:cupin superfamily protein [Rhypophila decipiens]|uniref:Cupin superfamily protein n=1 Tax=Rhypophila decipiens TaxID=261697 RepID=A0AAN6Y5S6_9PEZI|nr:cupin superfamily protein [Rhypophila decipiens]
MVHLPTILLPLSILANLNLVFSTPHSPKPKPIQSHPASSIITLLNLTANPEKGYFTQTFLDPDVVPGTNRSLSTAIYYLLEGREGQSLWHRVDQAETWHFYAGAPLELSLSWDDGSAVRKVGVGEWQSATSLGPGAWSLVGTTVAPGFTEDGYEIAPPGWTPRGAK